MLARQKAMAARLGERPDWDIHPGFFEPIQGVKALEKHQAVTRLLHEAGGLVVGGTDCGALSYPPPGFALLRVGDVRAKARLNAETAEEVKRCPQGAALPMTVNAISRPEPWHEDHGWPSPPDPGDLSRRVAQRRAEHLRFAGDVVAGSTADAIEHILPEAGTCTWQTAEHIPLNLLEGP